jgi:hypothetical protein
MTARRTRSATPGFRCRCCGYFLPRAYEASREQGVCYRCGVLNPQERAVMMRRAGRRARLWRRTRGAA